MFHDFDNDYHNNHDHLYYGYDKPFKHVNFHHEHDQHNANDDAIAPRVDCKAPAVVGFARFQGDGAAGNDN
jgi:hypothetical protein